MLYDRIGNAPVRVTVYVPRQLYEEATNAALCTGLGNLERLIISLLENFVEELKEEGYDLRPFWEKEKGEVAAGPTGASAHTRVSRAS